MVLHRRRLLGLVRMFAVSGLLAACAAPAPVGPDSEMLEAARAELGRHLFYDADLSLDGTMACATCHEQKNGFAEHNATHPGVTGEPGIRNAPGLANVAHRSSLTWSDPAIGTLEAQAMIPLTGLHPVEMGMARMEAVLVERLGRKSCYRTMFASAFPDRAGVIEFATVSAALAAFERRLVSSDAPYDRFMDGEGTALTDMQRRGAALFFGAELGCSSCHAGRDFTDATTPLSEPGLAFHSISSRSDTEDDDLAASTGDVASRGRFRTPSLRNASRTAPFLHDGSAATLRDAILAHDATGFRLPEDGETAALEAFLASLTDEDFLGRADLALPVNLCSVDAKAIPSPRDKSPTSAN